MDQNFAPPPQQRQKVDPDLPLSVIIPAKEWAVICGDIHDGIERRANLLKNINEQLVAQTTQHEPGSGELR